MIWIAIGLIGVMTLFFGGRDEIRFSILVLAGICLVLFYRIRSLENKLRQNQFLSPDAQRVTADPQPPHADAPPPPEDIPIFLRTETPVPSAETKTVDDDRIDADLTFHHLFTQTDTKQPEPPSSPVDSPVLDPEPVLFQPSPPAPDPDPDPDSIYPARPPAFLDRAWRWLKAGNPVVKVGLVILLLGVSFLLKYAAAHVIFPPELRAAAAGLLGIALLFFGWKFRETNRTFALLIQGGGIATLYLTIFAATRFMGLLPPEWALILMTAIVVFSAILAILQDAMGLAVFGWAGGFMAPILLSTGRGTHVHLFSYYALLNAGLLGVCLFRHWRFLYLTGFTCTFGVGSAWGLRYYKPAFFSTTEPFLILFFLIYGVISILSARSGSSTGSGGEKAAQRLDSVLVFGLPLVGFGLQAGLVRDIEMGTAFSCLALSAWYLVTARFLWKEKNALRLLGESHIGLGIVFLSLSVPMALDATATASTWALEGAGMVWLGLRQKRLISRVFGLLLQIGAAVSFFMANAPIGETGSLLAGLFLGIGGFVSSWAYGMFKSDTRPEESALEPLCGLWGGLFWYGVWWTWCMAQNVGHANILFLIVTTLSHLAWTAIALRKTSWPIPDIAAQLLIVFLFFIAFSGRGPHPAAHYGWLLWPVALGGHFASLYFLEKRWQPSVVHAIHTANVVLIALLCMWEARWVTYWFVKTVSWSSTIPPIVGGLLLTLVGLPPKKVSPCPLSRHRTACMHGGGIVAAYLCLWWMAVCRIPGDPSPLPYLPVLNILDLGQALVLVFVFGWMVQANRISLFPVNMNRFLNAGLAAAIFIWINAVVTRMAHFWWDVAYTPYGILHSEGLQAAYSVLWTLMAVLAMVYSHRRLRRKIWMVGTGLLGIVVIKLFFVDLSSHGTVARIISFLGVGILMLVVGYLYPLPPKEEKK